jgi:hypothetical protein
VSYLDALIYGIRDTYAAGVLLTKRSAINFGSGLTAVDNPGTGRTDVTSSVAAPTGTGLPKVVAGVYAAAAALLVDADVAAGALIAWSKLASGTVSLPAVGSFVSTVNAKCTVSSREPVNVQTTTLTTTTLDSITLATGAGVVVTWLVNAIKSDSAQHGAWQISASFRNVAGTLIQQGSTPTITAIGTPDDAAWVPTIDSTGTTIRLRVPGKAAITVQWAASGSAQVVVP